MRFSHAKIFEFGKSPLLTIMPDAVNGGAQLQSQAVNGQNCFTFLDRSKVAIDKLRKVLNDFERSEKEYSLSVQSLVAAASVAMRLRLAQVNNLYSLEPERRGLTPCL